MLHLEEKIKDQIYNIILKSNGIIVGEFVKVDGFYYFAENDSRTWGLWSQEFLKSLVSELEKTTIKVDNKEEERPLCPKDYYFDSISKNPVAYQDLIEEEKAKQIMDDYKNATIIKPLEEETSGGKRKHTFRRRKQRKQRKTSKK
jgi:hypothetical protein